MMQLYFGVTIFLSYIIFTINSYKNECRYRVGGITIDLNHLYKPQGYSVENGKRKFILNICGSALTCRGDVAVCDMTDNQKFIGFSDTLKFLNKEIPTLRYSYGLQRNPREGYTDIEFKCNRNLKNHNIQYIEPPKQGKKFKFVFETSFVCAKQPMNCLIHDKTNNWQYDVNSLFKKNDNWIVKNTETGTKIFLNMCGNLNSFTDIKNECSYNGTQVCLINNQGHVKNLGVFSSEAVINNEQFSYFFTGGSLCPNSRQIQTKIYLICSFDEKGPALLFSSDCEYHIIWHTPVACPHYIFTNEDCKLQDSIFGFRNLKSYFTEQKMDLPNNNIVKFSICKPLSEPCRGQNNVSFCLINGETEIEFGSTNNTIIYEDGDFRMSLSGEKCKTSQVYHTVNVILRCSYLENKPADIIISPDMCTMNVTVFTNLVCREFKSLETDCKTKDGNNTSYDITSLISPDRNYQVADPDDPKVVYLLNVCQPVVISPMAECSGLSVLCLRNDSEPNRIKRFKSLGNYNPTALVFENNELFLKYDGSGVCLKEDNTPTLTTKIVFKCAEKSKQERLQLASKSHCQYIFIWETEFACSIHKSSTDSSTGSINDIIKDRTSSGNKIKFNSPLLETISTLITDKPNTLTDKPNLVATTQAVTPKKQEQINIEHSAESHENARNRISSSFTVPFDVVNTTGINIQNCTVTNNSVGQGFNMLSLPRTVNVTSDTGKIYSVNICNSRMKNKCTTSTCLTNLFLNPDRKMIEMDFFGRMKCNDGFYNSVIFMKCSEEFHHPSIIKEDECSVQLEWKNKGACSLFRFAAAHTESPTNELSNSATISVVTVLVISAIVATVLLYLRYRRRQSCVPSSHSGAAYHRNNVLKP